jgi:hypothetical protein
MFCLAVIILLGKKGKMSSRYKSESKGTGVSFQMIRRLRVELGIPVDSLLKPYKMTNPTFARTKLYMRVQVPAGDGGVD